MTLWGAIHKPFEQTDRGNENQKKESRMIRNYQNWSKASQEKIQIYYEVHKVS